MEVSVQTLLVLLWVKSCLNWAAVWINRPHFTSTFSGFLSISVALGDTLLNLALGLIFLLEDFNVSGVRFTKYHICLLVQIVGFIYGLFHWPAFLLIGVTSFWSTLETSRMRKWTYFWGTLLLWVLASLHVLLRPDSSPITDDNAGYLDPQRCKLTSSSHSRHVVLVLLLTLASLLLYASFSAENHQTLQLKRSLCSFLSTWSSFLLLLLLLLLLQAEVPAHLDMNVPWLGLLHSFHITLSHNSCPCLLCGAQDNHEKTQHNNSRSVFINTLAYRSRKDGSR